MSESRPATGATALRIADLAAFERSLDTFMRPAWGAAALLGLLLAYLAFGVLLLPFLAIAGLGEMAFGVTDTAYTTLNVVAFYAALPGAPYCVYLAFDQFRAWLLLLSFALASAALLMAWTAFTEAGLGLSPVETGLLVPNATEFLQAIASPLFWILVAVYLGLLAWYVLNKRKVTGHTLFHPLLHRHYRGFFPALLRYGVLSNGTVFRNLAILLGRSALTFLVVFIIALPFVFIGLPSWFVAPAVFFSYGSRRFVRHYNDFRRRSAVSASELYGVDRRGQVLFLRSFGVDGLMVRRRLVLPRWLLGAKADFTTLEQVLVDVAFRYGPVGALSDPSKNLQPLGAARDESTQDNWQAYVAEKLESAQDVIYILGETQGLDWELNKVVEKGYQQKVLFVFPPEWVLHADNRAFYERFLAITGVPEQLTDRPVLLYHEASGAPVLVTARKQSEREYRFAMLQAFEARRYPQH